MLVDAFGRRQNYLRLSLTERCNFGCVYCVPRAGLPAARDAFALTRAEILRLTGLFVSLGIQKVRLTGGEPLMRRNVIEIVSGLKNTPGLQEVSMTTNGSLLSSMASELKASGLNGVNISLDRLNPQRFLEITGSHLYERVLQGTHAALAAGLKVKLNMVVLRDLSEKDICEFVELAMQYPIEVRFLEFMPLCGEEWDVQCFWPIREVRQVVAKNFLLSDELLRHQEVAQTFSLLSGKGKVGFIGSVSESFCENCTRLRVSVDGKIKPCLFSNLEFPLGGLLKSQASDEAIVALIRQAVAEKPRGNLFFEKPFYGDASFNGLKAPTPLIHNIGG